MNELPPAASSRPTHARYVMLGWLATMCLIAYVHRGCISVLDKKMQTGLSLNDYEMSLVHSAFFWSYAVLQIPGAWVAERWGVRLMLSLNVMVWSISTALMGVCQGAIGLISARLGMGTGQAGAFPSGVLAVSRWFPVTQRGLPSGIMTSFMLIGLSLGQAATGKLLNVMGWREIFALFSLLGVAWAAGFYYWFRETPALHSSVNAAELQEIEGSPGVSGASGANTVLTPDTRNPWPIILASPTVWLVFAQHFLRATWTVFLMSQFPRYLREVFHLSESDAGYFASGIVMVGVLGNWAGGFASDWIIRRTGSVQLGRQGLAVAMLLSAGVCVSLPFFVHSIWPAAILFGLSNILAGTGGPAAYAITIDIGGSHVSKVFASMNMMGNFGGGLAPLIITSFVKLNDNDWSKVPLFFAVIYFAAAVCWMPIKTRNLFERLPQSLEPAR